MGYTHYCRGLIFTDPEWEMFRKGVRILLKNLPNTVKIQKEYDNPARPLIGKNYIVFNGVCDEGHETFWLNKATSEFSFTKTARKPYDLAVCGVLMLASYHATSGEISSDGIGSAQNNYPEYVDQEWKDAWKYFQTCFKIGTKEQIFKLFAYQEVVCRLID